MLSSSLQWTVQPFSLIVHTNMLTQESHVQRLPVCAIDLQGLYLSQLNLLLCFPSVCSVSRSNKNVHRIQSRRKRKPDPLIRGLAPLCCVLSCVRGHWRMHRCMLRFKEMSFNVKIGSVIKILYCDTSVFIPDTRAANSRSKHSFCL